MSSLAAARADNFYFPPDFDPEKHKSLNQYHGTHALRERAKKIDQGILVIRFEVPFNVWCLKCGEHIAKGERFNAEKKQVGNYYSTKIWSFGMRHHCGCRIVIQTDPKNTEYVCIEGARRKVETYTAKDAGVAQLPDDEEKAKLASDPIYRLEQGLASKVRAAAAKGHLAHLRQDRQAKWDSSTQASLNRQLRTRLREGKRLVAEQQKARKKHRLHPGVDLLPVSQVDSVGAQVAALQQADKAHSNWREKQKNIMAQPILSSSAAAAAGPGNGAGKVATGSAAGSSSSRAAGGSRALVPLGSAAAGAAAVTGSSGAASRKPKAQGLSAAGTKLLANRLQALAKSSGARQGSVLGKRSLGSS